MPNAETLLIFAALSLGLALTPGPNMLYLVSRTLAQGTQAGMVSLAGCQCGSLVIALLAAAGITAALLAVPYAWDVLRLGGAAYLAWLAWQCVRPGGRPLFSPQPMPREGSARLFSLGAATALLNPKVALFYMAVLPPFLSPEEDNVFLQAAILGAVQITICTLFDTLLVLSAGGVARFLTGRPFWMAAQRLVLGTALGLLAAKLALTPSRP
jgi:threonine/homoserine/homoserine lactone efflux protein